MSFLFFFTRGFRSRKLAEGRRIRAIRYDTRNGRKRGRMNLKLRIDSGRNACCQQRFLCFSVNPVITSPAFPAKSVFYLNVNGFNKRRNILRISPYIDIPASLFVSFSSVSLRSLPMVQPIYDLYFFCTDSIISRSNKKYSEFYYPII